METVEEREHEVVNFAAEVCRHDKLNGVTIQASDGNVMKGTCLLHLQRWGNERTLLVSREEVTLAGRRIQAVRRIRALVEELGSEEAGEAMHSVS